MRRTGRPSLRLLITWILGELLSVSVSGHLYSSIHDLRIMRQQAVDYSKELEGFIQATQDSLEQMKQLISQLATIPPQGDLYHVEHPVGAFKLIHTWKALAHLAENEENRKALVSRISRGHLPEVTEQDLAGSADAILRVQRVFKLPTPELANGHVRTSSAGRMTCRDMEYLGLRALAAKDYVLTVQWMEEALNMTSQDDTEARSRLLFYVARGHYFIGDLEKTVSVMEQSYDLVPGNSTNFAYLDHYRHQLAKRLAGRLEGPTSTVTNWTRPLGEKMATYEALCRGQVEKVFSPGLYCRYRSTRIPYAFVKEEVLSVDPRVMILHEVISEKDIQMLKARSMRKLHRAAVTSSQQGTSLETTEERVSEVGWLWDFESPDLLRLAQLVSLYTGLDTEYAPLLTKAEPFQVINYGLGGQYNPHHDFFDNPKYLQDMHEYLHHTGDRIATFMFYLSDVKAGGSTVFPHLKVEIPPIKGAAAFWYNVKRTGENDYRTLHAGCPVLLGEKWVANKWIRERGQEWRRPCGLKVDDID